MCTNVTVDACIGIRSGCPVDYLITPDKQVEFSFGGKRDGFHFAFVPDSLREFLRVGAEALAKLEGQRLDQTGAVSSRV